MSEVGLPNSFPRILRGTVPRKVGCRLAMSCHDRIAYKCDVGRFFDDLGQILRFQQRRPHADGSVVCQNRRNNVLIFE